jgi:NhaP-type Na+/H+ or K+/H+ antiporter
VETLLQLDRGQFELVGLLVVVVTLVLILTRVVFIYVTIRIEGLRRGERQNMRLAMLAAWAGARGPVSGMAAFSIPLVLVDGTALPYREELLATTFVIILVTLLLSQTLAPLARRLGVQAPDDTEMLRRIDATLARAALRRLDAIEEEAAMRGRPIPADIADLLRDSVEQRLRALQVEPEADAPDALALQAELRRLMIRAEQEEILRIRDEEGLPDSMVRPIQQALDVRLLGLGKIAEGGH